MREMFCDYINRFNLEKLEVGECSVNVGRAVFTNGLRDKALIRSIDNKPLKNFEDIMCCAK